MVVEESPQPRGYITSQRVLNAIQYSATSSWRARSKKARKLRYWSTRGINKLPTEILTQIIEYVALTNLEDNPQNEETVHERSKAERTRALDLRPLRFVNRAFYMIVQSMVYTRINITSVRDFERLSRILVMRERLANLVLDLTVDIDQMSKAENWRNYGTANAYARPRESSKLTVSMVYLIRDIHAIFENCKCITRFAFHCNGAARAFSTLGGHYPSLKKLSICDELDIAKSMDTFWRNIARCPNLEQISFHRPKENRDFDMRPLQLNPKGKNWANHTFANLKYLKFLNSPEVSDKVLLALLPNLPQLSRLFFYECKLVTSSGIARVVSRLIDRLTEFVYCDFVDCNGRTSEDEEKTKKQCHLCPILARCSQLRDLSLSAYRCCPELFNKANWPHLRNLKVDMMFYTGCNEETDDTPIPRV
ncbi:hypothetical protein BDZ91DRAFT_170718 [Kalaharituber pfeilii]|nr:hypothetical protein BDZ91DRAFT_170718 [Kalaharituber pfeilii]